MRAPLERAGILFTKLFSPILFSGRVRIRKFVVKLPPRPIRDGSQQKARNNGRAISEQHLMRVPGQGAISRRKLPKSYK
jgi:hypothetical protein